MTSEQPPEVTGKPFRARRSRLLWAVLLAGLILVPAVAATVISLTRPPTYAADVDLLFQTDPSIQQDSVDRLMATHTVLLQQGPLVRSVAETVGRDPEQFAEAVSVEVLENSTVLRVRVTDRDAATAREAAQLLADRYGPYLVALGGAAPSVGPFRELAPAAVLPDPVAPQPLRAAAAGALVGVVLAAVLLLLPALRRQGRQTEP